MVMPLLTNSFLKLKDVFVVSGRAGPGLCMAAVRADGKFLLHKCFIPTNTMVVMLPAPIQLIFAIILHLIFMKIKMPITVKGHLEKRCDPVIEIIWAM